MVNLRTFHQRTKATRLGDITYLPNEAPRYEWPGQLDVLQNNLTQLPSRLASQLQNANGTSMANLFISAAAAKAAAPGAEKTPRWFKHLPDAFRRNAEREYAIHAAEDPQIVLGMPFTNLGGYIIDIRNDTLLGRAFQHFKLYRLIHIRQLAWLTSPVLPQDQPGVIPFRFDHHRLSHSWDVAAIANLLGYGVELALTDRTTLTLAAATHDARTPAGGDTTKILDRDFFDEDKHYPQLLASAEGQTFLHETGIAHDALCQTILGKGTLGRLLDIADKTAYVSRDAFWFHQRVNDEITESDEGGAVHELLTQHPDVCHIWRNVSLINGQPVFRDAQALARFLRLRVLLFRALYFHPASRFTEFIVGHLVLKHLVATKTITFNDLLRWTDTDLDRRVEVFGHLGYENNYGEPVHEGFDDEAQAKQRERELRDAGEICVMIETMPKRVSSGMSYLVQTPSGPQSLADAKPKLAQPIDALARVIHPYRLYWVPRDTLPPRIRDILTTPLT